MEKRMQWLWRLRHSKTGRKGLALLMAIALVLFSLAGIFGLAAPAAAQGFTITPQQGPYTGGTLITVNDNGAGDFGCPSAAGCFGAPQQMLFGSQAVSLTVVSPDEVQATAPPGCGTVQVWAEGTAEGGIDYDNTYLVGSFTYANSPPTISGISPADGTANGGTIVTITGTNLAGVKEVWFGQPLSNDYAKVLSAGATAVSVLTPSGQFGPEAVNVFNGVCSSQNSTVAFDFVSPPWVSSVTPSSGPSIGGTPVTLQGDYFTGASAVDFGTNPAVRVTVYSDVYLTAVSPPGAGTVDVTVYNPVAGWSPPNSFDKFTYACGSGAVGPGGGSVGSCDGQGTLQIPPGALSGPASVTLTPADLAALAKAANHPTTSTTAQQLLQWFQKATAAGATSITVNGQQIAVPSDWQDLPAFLQKLYAALGVPTDVNDQLTGFEQAAMGIGSGNGTQADLQTMQSAGDWLTSNLGLPPSTVDPQGTLAYLENADRDAFLFGTPPKYTNSQDPWYEAWLAAQSYAASNGCDQNCIDATFYGPGLDGSLTTNPASVTCQGVQCYNQAVQYDLQRVQWIMDTPGTGCLVSPATCGGDPPPGDPPTVLQGLGTMVMPFLAAPNFLPPLSEGMQVDLSGASLSQTATLSMAYDPSSVPAGDTARVYSFVYSSVSGSVYAFSPLDTTLANGQASAQISVSGDYGVLPAPNPAPQVTGLSPATGFVGSTVSITGSGFAGATAVEFGGTPAASFTVESGNVLTAVAPPGTGAVSVTVTTPQGTSLSDALSIFTYAAAAPVLNYLSPTAGPTGTALAVYGSGFGTVGGAVYFTPGMVMSGPGSSVVENTYSSWSDTEVAATVPVGLSPGMVSVAVYSSVYGMSNSVPFLVTPPGITETTVGTAHTISSSTPATAGTAATGTMATAGGGTGTVSTGGYTGDPAGAPAFEPVGGYFDVSLSDGNTFTSLVITKYGASPGDTMYWWNGNAWVQVSPAAVYDSTNDTLSFTVTASTTPNLADLNGTPFVLAAPTTITTPSPTVSSGGGGGGSALPALAISTASLPAGTVGQPYSATIATNNEGTPPYTFAVTGGTLPAGLTLAATGVISGTATAAGTYTITVTVKDAVGNTASQAYTLTVNSVSVTPPAVTPPAVTPPPVTKPAPVSFSDIATSWAKAYILKLAGAGVINGYPDGTFRPNNYVTRAEFVKMLVLADKLPLVTSSAALQKYTDFASFQPWELPYLATAVKAGIINGYPNGTLQPGAVVDRIQMAAMVGRTISGVTGGTLTFKDDATIPTWGKGPLSVDVAKGLINGLPNGTFAPDLPATRAQAAKVLAVYMGL